MYRDVEKPLGLLDPIARTFLGGFQLPVLNTISHLPGYFGSFIPQGVSPFPLFVFAGAILMIIWLPMLGTTDLHDAHGN